jgi:hypothetical protein
MKTRAVNIPYHELENGYRFCTISVRVAWPAQEVRDHHPEQQGLKQDRRAVLNAPGVLAIGAIESVRLVASLVAPCLSDELMRAAATLEKAL